MYINGRHINASCQILSALLSPRFLAKVSGVLLSPPSVCPSVRLSVRYVISSQTAGQDPTKFGEWLAYTSGACKSTLIFGPAPWGPGEGSKGQILTISNFKVNFKDFFCENVHIYSVVIDVKHIERDLLCDPRNSLWGGTGGGAGSKIKFLTTWSCGISN